MARKIGRGPAVALAAIISFAAVAHGGRDLWAATAVYLAVLATALAVLYRRAWDPRSPGYSAALAWPLGGLAAVMLASFARAVNPGESFSALCDWLAGAVLFLTALNVFSEEEAVSDFLVALTPVIVWELLVSLGQRELRHIFTHPSDGTMGNSNVMTAFLLPWIPAMADRFRQAAPGLRRRLWGAALSANVAGMLLFISNWGMICLAAALPFFWGPGGPKEWARKHPRRLAVFVLAALAVLVPILVYKFTHRIDFDGNPVPPSRSLSRLLWWASGLRMFGDHPWLGVGLGNYPSAYLSYKVGLVEHTLSAHSLPVMLLAETGLLGAGAFLLFLAALVGSVARHWERVRPRWPYLLGAALLLLFSTMSAGLEYLANILALFCLLGIGAAGLPARTWRPRRSTVLVLAALGLAGVPYLLAPLQASRLCVSAEASLQAGDWPAAERAFAAAAALFPLSSEAERGWAAALHGRSMKAAAVAHQERAIELDRRNALLWKELADYRLAEGRAEEARTAFQRASELHRIPYFGDFPQGRGPR